MIKINWKLSVKLYIDLIKWTNIIKHSKTIYTKQLLLDREKNSVNQIYN